MNMRYLNSFHGKKAKKSHSMASAGKETLQAQIKDDTEERKVSSQSMRPIGDEMQENFMRSS